MPVHEAVQNTIIPRVEEKPIPTRTVTTRAKRVVPVAPAAEAPTNPVQTEKGSNPAEETPAATTEESVRLSPQLSALARREQAHRQRDLALKEREKAMEADAADAAKFRELKAKLSAKDFSEAEALGLDYQGYTEYRLKQIEGENPLEARIKELEAKIEAQAKGSEESAAAQYEETVAEYKKEITKEVGANPDFSTVKGIQGGEQAVLQLILDSFEEDGEELTILEAAKLVEEQLVERGKLYTSLPKFKTEVAAQETPKPLPRPVVGKTLTNDMIAGSGKTPLKPLSQLPEAERYAEARRRALEKRTKGN